MATEELRIIIRAQDQASAVIRGISNETNNFMANAVKGAAAGVGFAAFNQITNAVATSFRFATDAVIGFNASMEQSRVAWSTMLGGAAQAQTMLTQLQQFAADTPFEFPDVERAARRLTAMGFAASQIVPLMTDVGNAAAALGIGSEGIDRITLALGQMSARTKVSAQDMLQLTEVGIPAWQILADATGQSVAQIQKSAEQGKVASQTFIDAFRRFSQERWGGLMDEQSRTFSGAVSTITDNVRLMLSDAFEPLFQGLSQAAQQFAQFTKSQGFRDFSDSLRNAQIAVGVFLNEVSRSGPILDIFRAALVGIATVMAVQYVAAVGRAITATLAWAAALVIANAPMAALGLAAAALALIIIANWSQVSAAATEFASNVAARLGELVNWITGTFVPALASGAGAAWERFANNAIDALEFVVGGWNRFWNQEIGPSGQSAFQQLQQQAQAGWAGFAEAAIGSLQGVLQIWNAFIGTLDAVKSEFGPLPGILGALQGKYVDVTAVTQTFGGALRAIPGIATQATEGFGRFIASVPEAVQRAIELVQAAGGNLAEIGPRILEEIMKRSGEVTGAFSNLGQQAGTAMGEGVKQTVKPLLEELARMIAQAAAGPATAALADTEAALERNRLLLQIRGLPAEVRSEARRAIRSLTRDVLPTQRLEAFDVNEVVRLTTGAEQAAKLRNDIIETQLALAGQTPTLVAGGVGAVAAPISVGVTPTAAIAPSPPPPPTQVLLRVEIASDDSTQVYEELIEANGQAHLPPVIQVSAVRRGQPH